MSSEPFWQTKLAARLHDPIEKALVLLRDPAGHENGTSKALTRLLGLERIAGESLDPDNEEVLVKVIFQKGLPSATYRHIQRADWWASAADRPQWPMQAITTPTKTFQIAPWAQVRWTNQPILIHPLTGQQLDLAERGNLSETDFHEIKQKSFKHFTNLLVSLGAKTDAPPDWRKLLLTYWRFGAEVSEAQDNGKLGELWRLLPADTRIPDHTIWDHLDLTSAFAGAFAADPAGEAALLTLAIGPVQPFIAAARTTSDLWAGSHLLSRLAWEAMRPLCEALGPDAILFPRLRGVPQVDLWLRDTSPTGMGLPNSLFQECEWNRGSSDANPLFSAALPNRLVAIVPQSQAVELAQRIERQVRGWLLNQGAAVMRRLLEEAGYDAAQEYPGYEQMRQQLHGFPEVHWAVVPFALIRPRNAEKQSDLDTVQLSAAMAPFFGVEAGQPCGFLASPAWQALQQANWGDGSTFFSPNPGVLYPAIYDLAERVLAAAKAVRPFDASHQEGWRCSLSGEAEWLTTDRAQLAIPPGSRRDTLWTRLAQKRPAWAKKGEHLAALPALKRLWPTLFAEEVGEALGDKGRERSISRFVVSTHTMALAHQLDQWLSQGGHMAEGLTAELKSCDPVALPRRLMQRHANQPKALHDARRLPALLDRASEVESDSKRSPTPNIAKILGVSRLESYYSLLMLDGDRMGAWLAGGEEYAISYRDSFHPQVQKGFDQEVSKHPKLKAYAQQKRALAPNRHLAISGALNDFSLTVVRHVVETERLGRVIYAGGDDVLAMTPVADLLPTMQRLRHAYSGHDPDHEGGTHHGLTLQNGFALLQQGEGDRQRLKLMRMMGTAATASCGAVIAHHQAPLGAVMRELRQAEQRAKNEGGRDAFSLTVIKRSGGALYLTAPWGEPVKLLSDLRDFLATEGVSRRAVYHTLEWLDATTLPPIGDGELLQTLLRYQFDRQTDSKADHAKAQVAGLTQRLTQLTQQQPAAVQVEWLRNFLSVAEFLARESRTGGSR